MAAKTAALKKLPTVSHVESVLSFLPSHPEEKLPILKELQPLLAVIDFPPTPKGLSPPPDLAGILSRINFKMDEAAKNLEAEKAATRDQIAETHRLINAILPLLTGVANSEISGRLAGFERHFFADLHDKWRLLRSYEKSALTSPP